MRFWRSCDDLQTRRAVRALWLLLGCCAACQRTPAPRAPSAVIKHEPRRAASRSERRQAVEQNEDEAQAEAAAAPAEPIEPAPVAGAGQVLVFRAGEPVDVISRSEADAAGLWTLDLGSDWVPALFRSSPTLPHRYESVFVELANGRFDDGPEGRRAAQERYLEPHGIPPSLALLQRRFAALAANKCAGELALTPLRKFKGAVGEEGTWPELPKEVVAALQGRLACEGHLRVPPSGELDQDTRRALEEFERRNRIYARASLQGETLAALRAEPLELERRALLRVLVERALLDLGIIEDGTAYGSLPKQGGVSQAESARDLVRDLEKHIRETFGLQTVAGARAFYARLDGVLSTPHYQLGIPPIELPEYYAADMDLWVEIDRGDLYYEFPFDAEGKPIPFQIERGPTMALFVRQGERVWPLIEYHTTIGGWRVRRQNGAVYWQYKESATGTRAWQRIVSAPVWLPPPSTPSETLVATFRRTADGAEFHALNLNIIGPSFASAYGLVAAYHQRIISRSDGVLKLGPDDGMRTHGSSDYTSIWRTVSSGCHRLHNHLAMRLLNFVLAHRSHRRAGHLRTSYHVRVSTPEIQDSVDITSTGYEFDLERPIEVHVLPGRVRGALKRPLQQRFPASENASAWPTILLTPTGPAYRTPEE
jgi:hypothetical protein